MKLTPKDPVYIGFDITYRCNARCHFCFLKNNSLFNRSLKELDYLEIKNLIDSFGNKKRKFYITGGEPLLRDDLLDIIGYIKTRGHQCTLTTNGTLLGERDIDCLLKYRVDEIVISLHGDRKIHEKTLNMKNSFKKVVASIRKINSSPYKTKSRLIIWCTINRYNYNNLYGICNLFMSFNPDAIAFNHLEFVSETSIRSISRIWKKYLSHPLKIKPSQQLANKIDIKNLVIQINKIKEIGRANIKFYPDLSPLEMEGWYSPDAILKKNGLCYGQWQSLWISPAGEVLSCQPIAEKFANIKDIFYQKIYNSKEYNRFRHLLKKFNGYFPICGRCGRVPYQKNYNSA